MNRWIKIAILPLLFCFLLYIKGRSSGTHTPINNIKEAIEHAKDGDTVYVDPGTYTNVNIQISRKFAKPVVVRPRIPGTVVFTGPVIFRLMNSSNIKFEAFLFQNTSGVNFYINGSSYIDISNNYFYQCGVKPSQFIIILVNKSQFNSIDFNTFDDIRCQGILIATYANNPNDRLNINNKIFRNHFMNIKAVKDAYPDAPRNGMDPIMIGLSYDQTLGYQLKTDVYHNLFENVICDGWEIISNKTSGNIIRENTFLNNEAGISIRSGNDVIIKDNYLDNTSKGIRLFGKGHLVENNYVLNCKFGIMMPSSDFTNGSKSLYVGYYQPDSITITGNFIINSGISSIDLGAYNRKLQPINIDISNNVIYYRSNSPIMQARDNKSVKTFLNNKLSAMDIPDTNLATKALQTWFSRIQDSDKMQPFKSKDTRVGIRWLNELNLDQIKED